MVEEKLMQEFRSKNKEAARKYFIKQIEQNELMSKKHNVACTNLNYVVVFFEV